MIRDELLLIAAEAGRRILPFFKSANLKVEGKSDGSPLTLADRTSHEFLTAELEKRFGLPVLSEEAPIEYSKRKGWSKFFLVDPLDGTKDFVAGFPDFTVNIALIEGHRPVAGIIHAPALGESFVATAGQGAWRIQGQKREPLPLTKPSKPWISCKSRFHDGEKSQEFRRRNGITEAVEAGAALKFGRLASGVIAVYGRFGPTSEWDTAAGDIILHEAGGTMLDLQTGELPRYNKPELVNANFLAVAPGVEFSQFL